LKPAGRGACAGLSLVETMIATSISMMTLCAVGFALMYSARSFVAIGNYNDLDQSSRNALDFITRDIRESLNVKSFTTNRLELTASDNSSLVIEYNPVSGELTRRKGGNTTVLLEECDFLRFNVYQRTPSNAFTFHSVQSNRVDLAKLVDVSWHCSRKILGAKLNTESVQTAKIVIRN
jgi:hypothetical protein